MTLSLKGESEDQRGKIYFFSTNGNYFGIAETKKGFARGGHWRPTEQHLYIISGMAKYTQKDIKTNKEQSDIIKAPKIIYVPPKTATLLVALKDTVMVETLPKEKNSVDYPEYRKIVNEKIKTS